MPESSSAAKMAGESLWSGPTHAAESRYAAIEGEALAVAEALEKCRHFILGCSELYVAVDLR